MSKSRWSLHGYAILCEAGCIADAAGALPPALMNDADWAYFQAELDLAALCILGRTSHEATPNVKGRLRAVMTRRGPGLERREDRAWFWNPAQMPADRMLATLAPEGGRVAVPGGAAPFDHFLDRFDGFHLSRKAGVALTGGRPCFSAQKDGLSPEQILARAGLTPGPEQEIDPDDGVTLTLWTRPAPSDDMPDAPSGADPSRPGPDAAPSDAAGRSGHGDPA